MSIIWNKNPKDGPFYIKIKSKHAIAFILDNDQLSFCCKFQTPKFVSIKTTLLSNNFYSYLAFFTFVNFFEALRYTCETCVFFFSGKLW